MESFSRSHKGSHYWAMLHIKATKTLIWVLKTNGSNFGEMKTKGALDDEAEPLQGESQTLLLSGSIHRPLAPLRHLWKIQMTMIMCELKSRLSRLVDSTLKNRRKVPPRGGTLSHHMAAEQRLPEERRWRQRPSNVRAEVFTAEPWRERESSDAGSGIPQRARRAGCLSSKPGPGVADSTISQQSFHFQQLKVIIHSQGWRNARTSGAGPILKHISQLDKDDGQIHNWPSPRPVPPTPSVQTERLMLSMDASNAFL